MKVKRNINKTRDIGTPAAELRVFITEYVKEHGYSTVKDIEDQFFLAKMKSKDYMRDYYEDDSEVMSGKLTRLAKSVKNLIYRGSWLLSDDITAVDVYGCRSIGKLFAGEPINQAGFISVDQAKKCRIPTLHDFNI